ncbi:SMI1/KNR4 family protein [Nannocystis bainbridge]|uniref:SMI1/KNR4 family protein n=1 Tax=Nannocystis bainbridge TaxID=2995303 RepID=A0ABT5DZV1_9BACT|nr:SMI1/KNR4 family protein [Nannocystis bainbridge]MDC0719157.1 SMI1/KNR4 family protein [Nannocystis bainbridge]
MEALYRSLVPDFEAQVVGATEGEVEHIEALAGRPLPRFYRWFLLRMGGHMGPFEYPTIDFTAKAVLAAYSKRLVHPDSRFLMIGHEGDEMMPLHVFYDLDCLARDDARVTKNHVLGGEFHHQFETLREMFAWGNVLALHVEELGQRCVGNFYDPEGDVLARLVPVLTNLGFASPIATGSHCGLFRGPRGAVVTRATPGLETDIHTFRMGAADAGGLRRILGAIACETALKVNVREWFPPLAP